MVSHGVQAFPLSPRQPPPVLCGVGYLRLSSVRPRGFGRARRRKLVTIAQSCQQSCGVQPRRHGRLAFAPSEEVPVSPSCSSKGLLIAENAG